jgi:hypothetical protein
MRTKTLALSALLGMLGTASLVAQTNVYSLNAVGYINVTIYPGYNIITCPLICSPDNTIATLLPNTNGAYQSGIHKGVVYSYINGTGFGPSDTANSATGGTGGWAGNGTLTINPGQAVFFYNNVNLVSGTNMTATFVGTVPQGSLTNALIKGYNLVGSIVPVSGDLVTNPISTLPAYNSDYTYVYDPLYYGAPTNAQGGYSAGENQYVGGNWSSHPTLANVSEGFWYHKFSAATTNVWVENFSVNP